MRLNKRAHTSPLYVFRIYFERVYLLEGREANPKRSRDTDTRPRQWRKRRKILSLFFALLGYIYIYILLYTRVSYILRSRVLLSLSTVARRRGKRERRPGPRGIRPTGGRYTRAEDEDSLDRWPVSIVARNAKGERSRKTTEREEALSGRHCVTLCAVRASRLGRGWRADERCYLGGAAMVTEQR